MNRVLIISIGTFAASVIRRLYEFRLMPDWARAIAIDTHDAEELPRLPVSAQCCIGDVPVREIYCNRKQYAWTANLPMENLRHHPENLLNGGSKIRAATHLALQWASQNDNRVERAIRTALSQLRGADVDARGLHICVLAGVISTTGSGGCLEVGMLTRRILNELGLSGSSVVTLAAVGSEGFEVPVEHRHIEAAFWREYHALGKGVEAPRPHDRVQPVWRDGAPFDYTFYFSRLTRAWNFQDIEDLGRGIALWLHYTALQPEVATHLNGVRGRHHAQLHVVNDVSGCIPCLSFSGVAAYDLNLPAVRDYGRADFGVRVADALLGQPAPQMAAFLSQVQLQTGTLRVRLGFQPDLGRLEKTVTMLHKALLDRPLGDWAGRVSTANLNLGRHLQETREALPASRRAVTAEIIENLDRLHRQAADQTQVQGSLKLLTDVRRQGEKARKEASDQLAKLQNVESIDTAAAVALRGLNLLTRKAIAANVRDLLQGRYTDALNALYLHEILRLYDDIVAWLDGRIDETTRLCATLEGLRDQFERERVEAVPTYAATTVRFLSRQDAAVRDYDEMLEDVVSPNNVATLKSELVASASREREVLRLAAYPADALHERIVKIISEQGWLDSLADISFRTYWERAFKSQNRKKQACEWLLKHAMPVGATVASGYAGQDGVSPPDISQVSVLVPGEVADEIEGLLREADPLLPAHAVIRLPRFHKIVAVFEEAGYELRAKQHLERIDTEYAQLGAGARLRLACAQWAASLPSYIPHEPLSGWGGSDLLLLGLVAGPVVVKDGEFMLRHADLGLAPLGADRASAESRVADGYRPELVRTLSDWLQAQTDVTETWKTALTRYPQFSADIALVYDKTRHEQAVIKEVATLR